ncbi:putative competence-damage inducible protein [Clostridia bacterium]|nr:putative competence-damage inducible protein [Clostridia bacterium]
MVAEILCVGTELIFGNIVNTNARFVAQKLASVGADMEFQTVVADSEEYLKKALEVALSRSDVVITVGGLGPTSDDLTKETCAAYFNKEMILDNKTLDDIKAYFKKRKITYTDNNSRQAKFPKGAKIIRNENGTAPGCAIEENGKLIIMLPGPPSELEPMFIKEVIPILSKRSNSSYNSKTLRMYGLSESAVEEAVKKVIDMKGNPYVATYTQEGEVHLRITSKADNASIARQTTDNAAKILQELFDQNIYSVDDRSLEETVVATLLKKHLTIACAESCTAGLFTAKFGSCSGVSAVLKEGVISYSNYSKVSRLNVSRITLETYGAVSPQTAEEMAIGVVQNLNANVGVGITGIAGPNSDNTHKPVGLVYIAVFYDNNTTIREYHFQGDRDKIRSGAVTAALDLVRRVINGII